MILIVRFIYLHAFYVFLGVIYLHVCGCGIIQHDGVDDRLTTDLLYIASSGKTVKPYSVSLVCIQDYSL